MAYLVFGRGLELGVALEVVRILFFAEEDLLTVTVDNDKPFRMVLTAPSA